VDDVARALRLSRRQIEALESDQFSALPGPTFVRGFIRNYARLVQLDSDLAIKLYNELNFRERPQIIPSSERQLGLAEERVVKRPFFEEARRPWPKYGIGLAVVAALLGLALYETFNDGEPPAPRKEQKTATAQPAIDGSGQVVQPLALPPQQAAGTSPVPAAEPAPAAVPAGDRQLRFSFSGDAWVEVKDKEGNVLSSQLNRAGGDLALQGKPPFHLRVGNASQVKLAYGDKSVDLAPFIRNEVATLTLE
jgi:cytoskeleton protein RodZ